MKTETFTMSGSTHEAAYVIGCILQWTEAGSGSIWVDLSNVISTYSLLLGFVSLLVLVVDCSLS